MSEDSTKELKTKSIWPWLQCVGFGFLGAGGILTILGMAGNYVPVVCGELGFDPAQFTLFITAYSFCMVAVQFVAGTIWLKVKTPILLFVCFTVSMIANGLMGSFNELWQWWVAGGVIGLFGGMFFMVGMANVCLNWFAKRVALAMSIGALLSGLGQALLSPVHAWFIAEFGWRMAYPMGAALGLVLGLPWIIFVIRFKPEDKGCRPYGWEPGMQNITAGAEDSPGVPTIKATLLSPAFICLFLGICITSIYGGFQTFWGVAAEEYSVGSNWGMEPAMVGALMISATGLFNLAAPLIALVIDKFGAAWTSFGILVLQVIAALGIMFLHGSVPVLLIMVFLFADINGIMLSCLGILMRSMFGARHFTKVNSYMQFSLGLVGGFGAPIVGSIYAMAGTFNGPMWFAIVGCVVIAILLFISYASAKKLTWNNGMHPNPYKPLTIAKDPVEGEASA